MKCFRSSDSSASSQAGFTLVEMAVVAALIGFMSVILITSFSRNRIDIDQSANLVLSVVREAQSKAIASATYGGYNPCGYGIHYISATQFAIYVGPNAAVTDCPNLADKNYQQARDVLLPARSFTDSKIQFTAPFNDIFFLPPNPQTFLNNNGSLNQAPLSIGLGPIGGACPTNCRTIYVYPSGKIESQ